MTFATSYRCWSTAAGENLRQAGIGLCWPNDDDSSDSRYRRNVETGQLRACNTRRESVAPTLVPGRIAAAEREWLQN